jgi:hypothetical protein
MDLAAPGPDRHNGIIACDDRRGQRRSAAQSNGDRSFSRCEIRRLDISGDRHIMAQPSVRGSEQVCAGLASRPADVAGNSPVWVMHDDVGVSASKVCPT